MTSTETGTSWSDRLSPRNWSLAWKLVAVGLVPALLAVVLGVLRVADQAQTASELGAANRLLEVRSQVADAATALRTERDRATIYFAERRLGDRAPLTDATAATDAAIEQVRVGLAAAPDLDPSIRAQADRAQGGFAQLPVLRAGITGSAPLQVRDVVQRYSTVVDRADALDRAILRQVRTPEVAGLADALTAVTAASESLALQHTVLGAALRVGEVTADDRAAVGVTDSAFVAALTDYQVALPPSQTPINFVSSVANARRDAVKSAIALSPTTGPIPATPQAWDDAVNGAAADVDRAGNEVRTALSAAGDSAEARSSNLAGVNSVLLMLGLLLAATIVVLVARTLTRSLRVLRSSALDVAQRRLPQAVESIRSGGSADVVVEPVPLHNRDEVGQVARAFDAVHGQALRLAADQAALQSNVSSMFVNLSRRSQGLVERQLQLIEQLESNEQDPDQLSNLFQLDHLATRMRRNSENLLVLAGTDFAKRNVAPVPLVDVLRAAVSEIEHYQRISVHAPPQVTIVGRATSDIVHLLAELLDNATNYSPPESQVVMSSMTTSDGSILVEIADSGVGMLEQELSDANRRLTTPSAVDVSASRRMGLFVVGRLGARHGITVHLGGAPMGGPGGGLTASVTLPTHLVASGAEGGRQPRGDVAVGGAPNGVPPQRAAQLGRPTPRAALAAPGNGQAFARAGGLNGLPTRTPGSSLRRDPAAVAAGSATEQPGTPPRGEVDTAADAAGARQVDGRPASGRPSRVGPDTDGHTDVGPRPGQAGSTARQAPAGSDAGPTRGVPTLSAAAAGATTARERGDVDGARGDGVPAAGAVPSGLGSSRRDPAARPGSGAGPQRPRPPQRGSDAAPVPAEAARPAESDSRPAATREQAGSPASEAARREVAAADASGRADSRRVDARGGEAPQVEGQQVDGQQADGPKVDGQQADDPKVDARQVDSRRVDGSPVDGPDVDAGEGDRQVADATPASGEDGAGGPGSAPADRPASPRPRPAPGPNGTRRDLAVPAMPYDAPDGGAGRNGTGQNGTGQNGLGQNGTGQNGDGRNRPGPRGTERPAFAPPTTPLPVVPGPEGPAAAFPLPESAEPDDGADALFSASVPAISEPDGLSRPRRPVGELRRNEPVDVTETTPIFQEIASAWFAEQRPVPVDWELGDRPGAEPDEPVSGMSALDLPGRPDAAERLGVPAPEPAAVAPAGEAAHAFASVADEGWRAASGVAAERPDELTAAGLPKRRPRARLVPGSAGSAVLAAPAAPTRSAENIRGRLASYQQGVRQGRETRLRRDPGGAGSQPAPENATAPAGGEHDEDNR